jgi:cytochrome c nitrite reductase small subunit
MAYSTRSGLLLALLLGVCSGLAGFTAYYAEATSYLSNNPDACVNCHIMREQHDGWRKAGHHTVATCNDCHVPQDFFGKYYVKVEHGYRHSKGFTLQDFHEPIQMKESSRAVVNENCIRCHATMVSGILSHERQDPGGWDCLRCHEGVGHGARR